MKERSTLSTLDAALAIATAARLDPYLTPAQVAAYLQITTAALARRRRRGGGPAFIQDGRLIRYRLSAVIAWDQSRTVVQGGAAQGTTPATPSAPSSTRPSTPIPAAHAPATAAWLHPSQRRRTRAA